MRFDLGVWFAGGVLFTFGAATQANAADTSPTVLEPSSHWQLDYGDERCRLGRIFGVGKSKTIFWMEQTGPSRSFAWLIAGGAIDRLGSTRKVSASFGPGFEPFEVDSPSYGTIGWNRLELDGFGTVIEASGHYRHAQSDDEAPENASQSTEGRPELNPADGARIEYIEFRRKDRRIRLATGNLADGFKALNACATDLYEFWGVDPNMMAQVAKGAQPMNMGQVARRIQQHYPRKAEVRGEDAVMRLKALIGADGRVEKCITIEKTKAENFDDRACELFKQHAVFEPAEDAEGTPVRDFFSTTVVYSAF